MIWRRLMLAVPGLEQLPNHVLDRVGRIARGLDAHVELFHCLYEPEAVQGSSRERASDIIAERVEERRRRLERLADVLREQGLRVGVSVRWDYPAYEAIIRHALRHEPDLLIIPAIRLDETLRALAYREARLIEASPAPVMFLKTREIYSGRCIVAAVPQSSGEAGDLDERILGTARTMAHALAESPVHVFGVIPAERHACGAARAAGDATRSGPEEPSLAAIEVEARIRRLALRHDVSSHDVHVESGEPVAALVAYARRLRTQMIVLGIGCGVPSADAANHLAQRVLDGIQCDLVVVKPPAPPVAVDIESAPAFPHPA